MAKKKRQKQQTPSAMLENSPSPEGVVVDNTEGNDEDVWDNRELGADPEFVKVSNALSQKDIDPELIESDAKVMKEMMEELMQEELLDLQDAARRFIVGYKEHWFPGIAKFAASQGVASQATESECRRVFALWGAKLK